jgi:hypothetical protein
MTDTMAIHAAHPATNPTSAELGEREGHEHDDHGADDPGVDGAGTGELRRTPRAEQPTRTDDRSESREHQRDRTHVAPNGLFLEHPRFLPIDDRALAAAAQGAS